MSQAIMTKYHGPTNTRGARITAESEAGHKISIPYPHELHDEEKHRTAAAALCDRLGWPVENLRGGAWRNGWVFVFVDD